jgi:hypothetical protein
MRTRAAVVVIAVLAACDSYGDNDAAPRSTGAPATTVARPTSTAVTTTSTAPAPTATTPPSPTTTAAPPPGPFPTGAPAPPTAAWWQPTVGVTWQWQLSGELDLDVAADVFEIDWETTTAADVAALHAQGKRVLCYVSAGSWEAFRPDVDAFPEEVLGDPLEGFPDERWLDVRRVDVLLPIIERRFDTCRDKGFDGVEADNVDGYANPSGFDLTGEDQLAYNHALADLAHSRGLAIALKNDLDQVPELVDSFDLAVNEQCVEFDECEVLAAFIEQGKPVLHAEYSFDDMSFCAVTVPLGFSSIAKHEELDAAVKRC